MSDATPPDTFGARLARERKNAGLTQQGLAQRSKFARGHIASVETGSKPPTPAFVAAVAHALGVDPGTLWGQPYGRDDHVHHAIPGLRRIVAAADIGPELDGPPRPLDELAAEVATAQRMIQQTQFTKLADRLPAVLEELTHWAYELDDARTWALLSRGYRDAASLTRRLGYSGDALALLERSADAGRRSQDPHPMVLVALARVLLLTAMDESSIALRMLDNSAGTVDTARPDAAELAGAVDLRSAIISARAGDSTRAWDYHGAATERLKTSAAGPGVHGLQVTPANAAIHGAAVAVELGDMDEATRRDQAIGDRTLDSLPPERRAHHEIDMARAHTETGAYDQALRRLVRADKVAPQMTTFHPTAQVTVDHLVDVRRTLPEPLRRLHQRMHA